MMVSKNRNVGLLQCCQVYDICKNDQNHISTDLYYCFRLKNNKARGIDGIAAKVIKTMGETETYDMQTNLEYRPMARWVVNSILLVSIFKKGLPMECGNYRTIALTPHASKILLTSINVRLKSFLLQQISDKQTDFTPGKGTREQILNFWPIS